MDDGRLGGTNSIARSPQRADEVSPYDVRRPPGFHDGTTPPRRYAYEKVGIFSLRYGEFANGLQALTSDFLALSGALSALAVQPSTPSRGRTITLRNKFTSGLEVLGLHEQDGVAQNLGAERSIYGLRSTRLCWRRRKRREGRETVLEK